MAKKSKGKDRFVVYSTNPDYEPEGELDEQDTLDVTKQKLIISLDKKRRKGKAVSLVEGFVGSAEDLKDLGKILKTKLGVGGSVKDGQIIIQGDFRQKAKEILESEGYRVKVH